MPHCIILAVVLAGSVPAHDLPLTQRVEAFRAVQRVYHAHQIGNTTAFEDAVPWSASETQVLATLNVDATPEELAREAERIRRNTKNPAMLREIERALGNDETLFAEIVARRTLGSRVAESDAGTDATCAGDNSWLPGALEGLRERARHTAVWTGTHLLVWGGEHESEGSSYVIGSGAKYDPATDAWSRLSNSGAPTARTAHTAVWTGKEMIVWGGWPSSNGGRYDPTLDRWSPIATTNQPSARTGHVAVWTGKDMIVWGGGSDGTGGKYDPALDRWTATSTTNAPVDRDDATAVWTGSVMVVWGGQDPNQNDFPFDSGGRYDPATNTWSATSMTNAPSARWGHAATWTGTSMLLWGGTTTFAPGGDLGDGRRYDPTTDTWTPISMTGAPAARAGASSAWTGSRWIVWGGDSLQNDGRRYDPTTDTWSAMASPAFSLRSGNVPTVWTETEMIVWGGNDGGADNRGGRYNPTSNTWLATSLGNGPSARTGNTAVWTGTEMIVWGGLSDGARVNTGGRFDPTLDAWLPVSTTNAPSARDEHVAVWTGSRMVVWGGRDLNGVLGDGKRYDPLTDTWTNVTATSAPSARGNHAAVWTGSRVVVWGGRDASGVVLANGGRYDPVADAWTGTTMVNAPAARELHSATWTGSRLVVWGGRSNTGTSRLRSGGRYDPATDTWQSTTLTNAPDARLGHVAVWADNRLVIWGGWSALAALNTGGRYDPATDTWSATTTTGAPSARNDAAAVSTGSEVVIWGGDLLPASGGLVVATGGRYDPATDTWTTVSTKNVPQGRRGATAVWTGEFMLVWGGGLDTGGTYVVGPPDADADGIADACDCAASDAGATAVPTEATVLRIASDKTALTWYASTGGSGTVHDVVRGTLATFPVGSGGESCLASGLAEARLDDPATPASGGWWYLVRGRNACGSGTYGNATGGTRVTATCP
jgi:N-acetylneuraminic acid mutarotase